MVIIIVGKNPTGIYLFKVNHIKTRTSWEICSKLTINVINNVLVCLLLTSNKFQNCPSVSVVDFEQINAGWVVVNTTILFFKIVEWR